MLAIQTKFLGPTDTKGSRIHVSVMESARTFDRMNRRALIVGCEDHLGIEENHRAAARKLITALGWISEQGYGNWVVGACERGYVFVCDTRPDNRL